MVEWKLELLQEGDSELTAALYECDCDGNWKFVDAEVFGPFETASDIGAWWLRQWSPRAHRRFR